MCYCCSHKQVVWCISIGFQSFKVHAHVSLNWWVWNGILDYPDFWWIIPVYGALMTEKITKLVTAAIGVSAQQTPFSISHVLPCILRFDREGDTNSFTMGWRGTLGTVRGLKWYLIFIWKSWMPPTHKHKPLSDSYTFANTSALIAFASSLPEVCLWWMCKLL